VFVFGSVLSRANETDLNTAGRILGLTVQADEYGRTDWRAAITEYAAADAERMVKAAFPVCCAWAETRLSPYTGYDAHADAYIAALAALGYTPDPFETAELDAYQRAHPRHEHADEPTAEPTEDTTDGDNVDDDATQDDD